jgi:hypothetical protein
MKDKELRAGGGNRRNKTLDMHNFDPNIQHGYV